MMGIACYFDATMLLNSVFLPFQGVGIFAIIVDKMLATDLPMFICFLSAYSVTFCFTLYICYPVEPTAKGESTEAVRLETHPSTTPLPPLTTPLAQQLTSATRLLTNPPPACTCTT